MCTGTHTRLSESLVAVALTREEVGLAQALLGRVAKLAAAAVGTNVKLMIDAEHTYFQPVGGKLLKSWCGLRASRPMCLKCRMNSCTTHTYSSAVDIATSMALCAPDPIWLHPIHHKSLLPSSA
jgi:hypothetical protein